MSWTRGDVRAERRGAAVLLSLAGRAFWIDAPAGSASYGRTAAGVLLTSGRLERVAGLFELLASGQVGTLWVPSVDARGALVGELMAQAWQLDVVVDTLAPDARFDLDGVPVRAAVVAARDGALAVGLRITHPDATIAYLPRCRVDASARALVRGADLVALEAGAFLPADAVALAGHADLLVDPLAMA